MFDDDESTQHPAEPSQGDHLSCQSPLQAVRAECIDCCNGSLQEVRLCPVKQCALWPLRFGRRVPDGPQSVVGAIRAKCLDCSGGCRAEVASCTFAQCRLHPFRFGKNPNRSPKGGSQG